MDKKTRIVSKKKIYEGHQLFLTCELEVPSLKTHQPAYPLKRELLKCNDSVLVLLYAPESDSFVFCEQFRAGVFFNDLGDDPFILECVAGGIDDGAPEDTARKEVFEEAGLEIHTLEKIACVYKSPGILTEKNFVFYAEVPGEPKAGFHGVDDEEIKTHVISRTAVYKLMDENKIIDVTTLLALFWFRANDIRNDV
jgi:ADP-ribose pyrophosphatase